MNIEIIIYGYFIGLLIFTFVLIDKWEVMDIVASFILSIVWPIFIPVLVFRRILR